MDRSFTIKRRELLSGLAAAPLLGIPAAALAQPSVSPEFSDTHVHLFNASDLPIQGFMRHVMIPAWDGLPVFALSYLIKKIANLVSDTASEELARLGGPVRSTDEAWATRFAEVGTDQLIEARQEAFARGELELVQEFDLIETALLDDAGATDELVAKHYQSLAAPPTPQGPVEVDPDFRRAGLRSAFHSLALRAEGDEGSALMRWSPGDIIESRSVHQPLVAPAIAKNRKMGGGIMRALAWAGLLVRSRSYHLDRYLETMTKDGARPSTLINHLVDFDHWLSDDTKSPQLDQVEVAARLAALNPQVELRTFAGYCPLRHALDLAEGRTPLIDRLFSLSDEGKVRGFKMYPPMGFLPLGNRGRPDAFYDMDDPIRTSPAKKWQATGQAGLLGDALDDALEDFYARCAEKGLPVMAHSRSSNGSFTDFQLRASPEHWLAVVDRFAINLMLGHLIDAREKYFGGGESDDSWPLAPRIDLLGGAHASGARVYGDLGMTNVLVAGGDRPRRFFVRLREIFGDLATKKICFGSDWIMYERVANHEALVGEAVRGMREAGYAEQEIDRVMRLNAADYLS